MERRNDKYKGEVITMTYQLSTIGSLLSHFPGRLDFVRDATDEDADTEMLAKVRVRSGDYFMTVATELDKLAQSIASTNDAEAAQLERLVSELLFIDRNYTIVNKPD